MFTGLQVLRFFAAMSVVVFHAVYYGRTNGFFTIENPLGSPHRLLNWGVPVFFALSGFLLARLAENGRPLQFLAHRVLRIYPAYFLASGIVALVRFGAGAPVPSDNLFAMLSLLPLPRSESLIVVEWTLVYEVFFYLVMTLLCALPSATAQRSFILLWLCVIFLANWLWPGAFTTPAPSAHQIAFSYIDLCFIAGVIAWWAHRFAEGRAVHLSLLGLAAFLVPCLSDLPWNVAPLPVHLAVSFGAACFVLAASTERVTRFFSARSALVVYGNGSYGVYLLHFPLLIGLYTIASELEGCLVCVAVIGITMAAGTLFGLIEYRLYLALSRATDRQFIKLSSRLPRDLATATSSGVT